MRVIRRVASTLRSASSGYQMEISRLSSDKDSEDSLSESRTPTGTYGSNIVESSSSGVPDHTPIFSSETGTFVHPPI